MRFSSTHPLAARDLTGDRVSNVELVRRAVKGVAPGERAGTLLLVGGRSPADLIVRNAQAHLRMDHLASYWSHSAVVLGWSGDPESAWGAEVSLDPAVPEEQVPERNGVTRFQLGRYLDDGRYPNLALVTLSFSPPGGARAAGRRRKGKAPPEPEDPRPLMRQAAAQPLLDSLRYPFLEWVAAWRAFAAAPYRFPNPSTQDMPHPGAAFCEYVLEAARVDITPGATAPNACPETIWATCLRWHVQMAATGLVVRVSFVARDPKCEARTPLSSRIDPPEPSPQRRRRRR